MSIKYKMIHRGDYLNPEGQKKTGYYPQVVMTGTLTVEDIAQKMSNDKKLQSIEMEGTIKKLFYHIEEELLNGNNVCIDGFGTFSLTAESRTVQDPTEIRAESIFVKRVTFKPSKPLKNRLKSAKFVRH